VNRRSADPSNRVLLLEAGGTASHPLMALAWRAADLIAAERRA
jgi:hypothetical protein